MNLRVDLILPTEQRSGNPVSAKSLGRMAAIILPLIVVGIVAKIVWTGIQAERDFNTLKQDLELTKPVHAHAVQLMETFKVNREVKNELTYWASSRLTWHEQILGLMQIVPTNVQLKSFRASEKLNLINDKTPGRQITLNMSGRAVNADAEESVKFLVEQLRNTAPFGYGVISNVVMDGRADVSPGAAPTDRTFEIRCTYFTRVFK
ncbi:MAG: hypothetical protein ACI9OU_001020 [Candidatus Promineifilaceae bacterium]|jgi:hypothetical protein